MRAMVGDASAPRSIAFRAIASRGRTLEMGVPITASPAAVSCARAAGVAVSAIASAAAAAREASGLIVAECSSTSPICAAEAGDEMDGASPVAGARVPG